MASNSQRKVSGEKRWADGDQVIDSIMVAADTYSRRKMCIVTEKRAKTSGTSVAPNLE